MALVDLGDQHLLIIFVWDVFDHQSRPRVLQVSQNLQPKLEALYVAYVEEILIVLYRLRLSAVWKSSC